MDKIYTINLFRKTAKAFTLIEIMVAVSIIAILSSIALVSYNTWQENTYISAIKSDANNVASAMENARNFNSTGYPSSISAVYSASNNVVMRGGSSDGGKTYCVDLSSSQKTSIQYYIDSLTSKLGAQIGTCASRSGILAAPTGFVATTASISSISLTFNTVSGATGYNVQQSSNASFTDAKTIATLGASPSLPYSSVSLNENTKYYYRVQTIKSGVYSPWSSIASAQTSSSTIAIPSSLVLSKSTTASGDSTTYSWVAPSCESGNQINYQYHYYINPVGYDSGWKNISSSTTSLTFTTSVYKLTYSVVVRARCTAIDKISDWSFSNEVAFEKVYTVPVLADNTSTAITTTSAYLGATIVSNGGQSVADFGTCWGTSANPTTNCVSGLNNTHGLLAALSTPTVSSGQYPNYIAISPDNKNVYVTNYNGANTISIYSRNTNTGILTSAGSIATGTNPTGIAISNDGASVYVNNYGSSNISMYSRNLTSGALTSLGTVSSGNTLQGIAVSPDGTSVYSINCASGTSSVYEFTRNTSTGVLTYYNAISAAKYAFGVVVSPDSKSVYVTNNGTNTISMYSRNTSTGLLTSAGSVATSTAPYGIAISPNGYSVYAVNVSTNLMSIYTRNASNSVLTSAGTIATGAGPNYVVVSSDGTSVYVANSTANTISMYLRNGFTGAVSSLSIAAIATGGSQSIVIGISPDGKSVYSNNSGSSNLSMFGRSLYSGIPAIGVPFTQTRTGITSSVTLHYRAYATNSVGTGYSPDSTFILL